MSPFRFLRWECKLQARGLRFRLGGALYLLACLLPAVSLFLGGRRDPRLDHGSVDYLASTVLLQGFLTVLLALALAGHRAGPGPRRELAHVLRSASLSSPGYQLGRWAALSALVLALSLVPLAGAAALAAAAGSPPEEPVRWAVLFLIYVAVPTVVAIGAWLTLLALGRGELMAVVLAFLSVRLVDLALDLEPFGWPQPMRWADLFGSDRFVWATFLVQDTADRSQNDFGLSLGYSEGAFDPFLAFSQWWPGVGLAVGLSLALALLSSLWLGRSRRDMPPLALSEDHPLRSILPRVYGFFLRFVPDAGLRREALAAGASLAVLLLACGTLKARKDHFLDLAERRHGAEIAGDELPVTSPGLRITEWRSEGTVGPAGVDLRWRIRASATEDDAGGDDAVEDDARLDDTGVLAFTVDPFLRLAGVVATEGRAITPDVTTERRWDRWIVRLDPPLRSGESLTLEARVTGWPREVHWALERVGRQSNASFVTRFRRFLDGAPSALAESYEVPAVSPRRVFLQPGMLGPVPRYTTWELTPPPVLAGDPGSEVPPEAERIPARVEVDLRLDGMPGTVLASACGGLSTNLSTRLSTGGRLVDGCRLPPHLLEVLGGPFVPVESTDAESVPTATAERTLAAASLPAHRRELANLVPTFRRILETSDQAWPGHPGLDRLAVMEWPRPFVVDPVAVAYLDPREMRIRTAGRLLVLPEDAVSSGMDLDLAPRIGEILARELLDRREMAPEDERALRAFVSALMARRMGAGPEHATVHERPWVLAAYRQPLGELTGFNAQILLYRKLPKLVIELEERLGLDVLVAATERFLARDDDPAGTMEELFALLGEAGAGRPGAETLDELLHGHWHEGGIPDLRLAEAQAVPVPGGWRVEGTVANAGGGHAFCPLVVRTEGPELGRGLHVPPGDGQIAAEVPFEILVEHRPHTVLLDPEGRCLRRARSPVTPETRADLGIR